MNQIALTNGNQFNGCVELHTKTGTTTRLMTKQEFKTAHPEWAGNRLSKEYNQHIKDNGKAMASAAVAFINQSGLLLKGVRNTKNTISLNFVKPESLESKPRKGRTITADQIKATLSELSDKDKAALLAELQQA